MTLELSSGALTCIQEHDALRFKEVAELVVNLINLYLESGDFSKEFVSGLLQYIHEAVGDSIAKPKWAN
jgi:hypothetical protein